MRSSFAPLLSSDSISSRAAIEDLTARGLLWAGTGRPSTEISLAASSCSSVPFSIPEIDQSLPAGGLQRGGLHEFFYQDPLLPERRSSLIPTLLAQSTYTTLASESSWNRGAPSRAIVWIGRHAWPTPYALLSHEHSRVTQETFLNSVLFIDPPNTKLTLWTIETALRSNAVALVIAECPRISLTASKRFELAAREYGSTALLLRDPRDLTLPSRALTKWVMTPTPSRHNTPTWELSLANARGGLQKQLSWLIGIHEQESSISVRVFPRVVDQCHSAETSLARFGT